jgi:levoglucosan dehydrogenase
MSDGTRPVLRIGMVGYGDVGRIHALCWRSLPYYRPDQSWRAEIVGVATSREETAVQAARELDCGFWTADFQELVNRPDVDLIDCVTPDRLHAPVAVVALEAGKHVYCEKPMATSVEEAARMVAAADRSGRTNSIAFTVRFVAAVRRARELVASGLLGRLISFRSVLLHSGYVDPDRPMSWRLDASQAGGGALYDLGSHNIDLIRHLLGEFVSVTARVETVVPERPATRGSAERRPVGVDDITVALAELEGGAVGTLEFSRVATGATEGPTLEAHGTEGAFRFDFLRPNRLQVFDRRRDEGFREVVVPERWPRLAFVPFQQDVGAAALRGAAPAVTFEDGYRVQLVLDAIQRAGRTRGWVDVPAGGPSRKGEAQAAEPGQPGVTRGR